MADFSRRSVLRSAALVPLATACARRVSTDRDVVTAAAVDGDVVVPLAQAPELARAGGAVVARPSGSRAAYLVVNSGTGHLAMRAECTHEGCVLAWVPEDRQAECPCHGSRFAGDGTVLNPPARADLTTYPAAADGKGNIVVHLFAGDGVFGDHRVQNGQVSFPIALFPVLANVGGAVLGRPDGFPSPLLVTRTSPAEVTALSAVCSHLGCTVLPAGSELRCPCHASTFDLSGKFLQGPAGTGLLRYGSTFDGTTVTVSTTPT